MANESNTVKSVKRTTKGHDYIEEMREFLKQERGKGLVGVKFFNMPKNYQGNSSSDAQSMAKAFCAIMRHENLMA